MSSAKGSKEEQPETLVQNVVRALITHIRDNQLTVGDTIPSEGEFGQLLGVSRTVVREAFKALAAMNIIEVSSGRRARVRAFDGTVMALTLSHGLRTQQVTVQQTWDVRRAIEMRAVSLACMHRTEKNARRLLELVDLMRASQHDIVAMTEHDIAFHTTIAESTRNPLYPVLVSSLTSAMRDTNPIVWQARTRDPERQEIMDLHAAIADAISEGAREKAIEALSRHFDEALKGLVNSGFN